jgi:hypothetical protein
MGSAGRWAATEKSKNRETNSEQDLLIIAES